MPTKPPLSIHVFAICFNEEFMLPYWLRHYRQYTDNITVYDNHSNDNSVAIMKAAGVDVRYFDTQNEIKDLVMREVKLQCWKGDRSDWVIIADIDEFIYHPYLMGMLERARDQGYTICHPYGFQMVSLNPPTTTGQLYEECRMGGSDGNYSKMAIFDPKKITDINYCPGAHLADPKGEVKIFRDPQLKLLHYHYLGLDRHLARYEERGRRLSKQNIDSHWGTQYLESKETLTKWFNDRMGRAFQVI